MPFARRTGHRRDTLARYRSRVQWPSASCYSSTGDGDPHLDGDGPTACDTKPNRDDYAKPVSHYADARSQLPSMGLGR